MASETELEGLRRIEKFLLGDWEDSSEYLTSELFMGHGGRGPDDGGGEFHKIQIEKPCFSIDGGFWDFSEFGEIENVSTGKEIAMFLDYDGTLSPIVEYPDQAFITDEKKEGETELAGLFGTPRTSGSCDNRISQKQLPCPRCESTDTKFCYYNNYSLSQPRHFCKTCRRYWTHGHTLRNNPVSGGARRNARRYRTVTSTTINITANASGGQDYPRADITAGRFHHKIINAWSPGNGHSGGSSEDDVGQFHTIQVDEADHHSVRSIENERQASPALINTSIASDQSNEQPPPDRSPSAIEIAAEIVQEEPEFDLSGLAKTFLSVSAGEGFASLAVRYGTGNPLSENARILLSTGELCSVAAFLLCSGGYIMERNRRAKLAARLMTVGGVVAATLAFVLMMGSLFTNF